MTKNQYQQRPRKSCAGITICEFYCRNEKIVSGKLSSARGGRVSHHRKRSKGVVL